MFVLAMNGFADSTFRFTRLHGRHRLSIIFHSCVLRPRLQSQATNHTRHYRFGDAKSSSLALRPLCCPRTHYGKGSSTFVIKIDVIFGLQAISLLRHELTLSYPDPNHFQIDRILKRL